MNLLRHWRQTSAFFVILEGSVLAFAGMLLSSKLLSVGTPYTGNEVLPMLDQSIGMTLLRFVLIPPVETFTWQIVPIYISRKVGLNSWIAVALSALLFAAALHWSRGVGAMVSAFWFWLVIGTVAASQRELRRGYLLATFVHYAPVFFLLAISLLVHSGAISTAAASSGQ